MLSTLMLSLLSLQTALAAPRPKEFYHPRGSEISNLFKRAPVDPNDPNFAQNYPAPGSTPDASSLPKAWTDKLASIQLPDVQPSTPNNGYPTYAGGEQGQDEKICSFTYECTTKDDLLNPPDGVIAVSFDDGPTSESPELYNFLAQNNISSQVTHFMIGGNIVGSPTVMQDAFKAGGHIACHTWSHQYTTTLSNEGVLAELGWNMQVIYDLLDGRVPMYWRPPYGDVDNRVRAIAEGVFGLKTVPWNQDSGDWAIGNDPAYTNQSVHDNMQKWITGSKSPGLLILEHETNPNTVGNFEFAYPLMKQNDWNVQSVAEAFGMTFYQNAKDNTSPVEKMEVAGTAPNMSSASASSSASSTPSASGSTSPSGTGSATSDPSSSANGGSLVASSGQSGAAGQRVSIGNAGGLMGMTTGMLVVVGTMLSVLL